jgi:hypothetical protein
VYIRVESCNSNHPGKPRREVRAGFDHPRPAGPTRASTAARPRAAGGIGQAGLVNSDDDSAAYGAALSTPGMGDRSGVEVPWRKRWCRPRGGVSRMVWSGSSMLIWIGFFDRVQFDVLMARVARLWQSPISAGQQ